MPRGITRRCAILAFLSAAVALPVQARQAQAGYASPGPYPVAPWEDLVLVDAERDVEVPVRVRFPMGEGPFPLIVFSHGLGADREAFQTVSEHWAGHGYIVVHPSHDDSGVGMSGGGMHPPEEKVRARLGDVVAVLDGLDQLAEAGLAGRIDRDRLAVAGHSYGSFITMLAGGVTVEIGDRAGVSLGDPRVRCVLPVSASGRGDYGLGDRSFNSLTKPALFFAGTSDIRNGRPEDWRLEPYHWSPAGDKYLVVIEGATHGSYGGGRGAGDVPDYVKAASTAFWDSCLRGSEQGRRYLTRDGGFRDFAGDQATISFK